MHFPFGIPMRYYTDQEECPRYRDIEKKGTEKKDMEKKDKGASARRRGRKGG